MGLRACLRGWRQRDTRRGPDDPGSPVQRRGRRRDLECDRPGDGRGWRGSDHHPLDAQPSGGGRGKPRCEAPARLRHGERPRRGRRGHLARRPQEASSLHGRARARCSPWPRRFRMARRLAPRLSEGRGGVEPVGGKFGSVHEGRPDRLQGARDRAARGERGRLGGRARGGRLARSAGGPRRSGSGATTRCSPSLDAVIGPAQVRGRAGLHQHPRVRRAGDLVRPGC